MPIRLIELSICNSSLIFSTITHNGYVYETLGISKRFPVKLQVLQIPD